MPFEVLQTLNTKYCADSVEWCPISPFQNYFVCGTYELKEIHEDSSPNETNPSRIGQLHLFSVNERLEIDLRFTCNSSAILDIKWYPGVLNGKILLATSNADGKVKLWEFLKGDTSSLICLREHSINSEDVLTLSIDWSVGDLPKICASDSKGFLTILSLSDACRFDSKCKLKVHDYEAWVATFNPTNDSVIFTGGDDCFLKVIDLRCNPQIIQRHRHHTCGVTSLRFNHRKNNILASGSYDEAIKLWDDRNMKNNLSSCEIGGGIWRIKWDPFAAGKILTAAMYSGVYELQYFDDDSLFIKNALKEHNSIAYGADYCNLRPSDIKENYLKEKYQYFDDEKLLTITCSFYDKKLCLCLL